MDPDSPIAPPAMSAGTIAAYALVSPIALGGLLFLSAGSIAWTPGWIFLGVSFLALAVSVVIIRRLNPIILRARSRFQPGTKTWDLRLVSVVLVAAVAIMPVAAFDAGWLSWSSLPIWAFAVGYTLYLAGFAITAWAQVVNEFFEPDVRIQTERHHRVIENGPYAIVRHPGYSAAICCSLAWRSRSDRCWRSFRLRLLQRR